MLTRNVKNVILFTKVILSSLLILYLLISKTFCNFAAVENPHPCMPWDAVSLLDAYHRSQGSIKLNIIMYYG